MKILIGSIYVGEAKRYALEPFERMCEALFPDIDVIIATDNPKTISLPTIHFSIRSSWATEICNHGKRLLGRYALNHGYDALVWQGIDCFYESREQFNMIGDLASRHEIIGALVAGRNMPEYPVCRQFLYSREGHAMTAEEELPHEFFDGGAREVWGYIGSDATIIGADVIERVDMSRYQEWHTLIDRHPNVIGPDEWFMRQAINQGVCIPICHTGCRPWHVHETGRGVRCFGEEIRLEDLKW